MKTVERISKFIEIKGLSLNAFDKSIGRPAGYIGKQIRSKASIGSNILETILRKHEELNPQWLISGEGEMLRNKNENLAEEPNTGYGQDLFEVTLLGYLDKPRVREKIKKLMNDEEGQKNN